MLPIIRCPRLSSMDSSLYALRPSTHSSGGQSKSINFWGLSCSSIFTVFTSTSQSCPLALEEKAQKRKNITLKGSREVSAHLPLSPSSRQQDFRFPLNPRHLLSKKKENQNPYQPNIEPWSRPFVPSCPFRNCIPREVHPNCGMANGSLESKVFWGERTKGNEKRRCVCWTPLWPQPGYF